MAKVETEFWLLDQDKISRFLFYLLILFLPTQFGKHFFADFSFVKGLRIDYLSPTLYFTDILIIGIFLFSFKSVFKILNKKHKQKLLLFLILSGFLLIGIFDSINYQAGLYYFIKLAEFTYLGIFAVIKFKRLDKKILAFCLGMGIVFESILAILQYLNQGSFQGILYFLGERAFNGQTPGIANASINGSLVLRPYATFSHPNVLAGYLNIALIFFLYFSKYFNKKLILLIGSLAGIGVLISLSRVGIFVFIVNVLIFFCITIYEKYKKGKTNPRYLFAILLIGLALAFGFLIIGNNSLFVQRFSALKFSDESVLQRSLFIKEAVEMFTKSPVFGVGLGNYISNLSSNFISHNQLQPVHNVLFLILSETGLIGLMLFAYVLKQVIFRIKNVYFFMLIIALISIGSFDHYLLTLQQGQILLVLIISIIMSERA